MINDKRWFLSAVLVFGLLTALLSGCGKPSLEPAGPQAVKTQTIALGSDAAQSTYAGEVRGRYESNLSFQAGGKIIARNVQLGSRVRAGEVLMTIDAKDIAQTASKASAQVDSAATQLKLAEANLKRYSQLYQDAAISAATLDQYQATYESAQAAFQAAQAEAVQGSNALGYTNLIADSDGVVAALSGEAGQVVSAGQTVLTLVQTDELEVEIHVPENRVTALPLGQKVTVSFWALSNTVKIDGEVREIAPMSDPTARTYKVRIRLLQPPAGIRLGMTASVDCTIAGSCAAAALLPLTAIYQTGEEPEVWLVGDDGRVHLQTVAVESFGDNAVKVKGLSAGTVVVTAGIHKLREGQEVRLLEGAEK